MNNHSRTEPASEEDEFAFATSGSRATSSIFDPRHDYGVRYILKGKEWYVRNSEEEWVPLGIEAVRRFLISSGLNPDTKKGEDMSDVDAAIHHIEMNVLSDFIGRYSGYLKSGDVLLKSGDRLLVPRNRSLPLVAPGDPTDILNFFDGALPDQDEHDAFLGWLQSSVQRLREDPPGHWGPGQALCLIGDTDTGKSSLQRLITGFLAGREANPTRYFTGGSTFNGELAEAEHWAISDPTWSDVKERKKFAKNFKNAVADSMTAIEPKYNQTVNVPIYKRISISLNKDEDSISVLPLMDKSYLEKLMILDCERSKYTPNAKNFNSWIKKIDVATPAFLHYLLHEYKLPEHLFESRYGAQYRNSRWEPKFQAPTSEDKERVVDEIIVKVLFKVIPTAEPEVRTLSVTDLHEKLFNKDSIYRQTALDSSIPNNPAYLGRMVTQWIKTNGGQRNGYRVEDGPRNKYTFTRGIPKRRVLDGIVEKLPKLSLEEKRSLFLTLGQQIPETPR
jgi:hypothetical protein